MPKRYWLKKCEPAAYTIDDLARDGRASWEGVRNYQARNFMRDVIQEGDGVLFYASNAQPSGVAGLAKIVRAGYPDHFAWRKGHKYFDEAGSQDAPVWYMVLALEHVGHRRAGRAGRQLRLPEHRVGGLQTERG